MKTTNQKNVEITVPLTEQTNKNDGALSKAEELLNEDNDMITDLDDQDLLYGIEQLSQNINKTNEDPEAKQFAEKIQRLKTVIEGKIKLEMSSIKRLKH